VIRMGMPDGYRTHGYDTYVGYDWHEQRWAALPQVYTMRLEDYDEVRFVWIGRAEAERLARGFGQELPSDEVLDRRVDEWIQRCCGEAAAWDRFRALRAERLAEQADQPRREAASLAGVPPAMEEVPMVSDRDRVVAGRQALSVEVGEEFPLLRFMVGGFHAGNNALTGPADLEIVVSVTVSAGVLAGYQAVTPFCLRRASATAPGSAAMPARRDCRSARPARRPSPTGCSRSHRHGSRS
jgi:hypothetical protein